MPDGGPGMELWAVTLARLDERVLAMQGILGRIERAYDKQLVDHESDKKDINDRIDRLEAWRNRILGIGLVIIPLISVATAYLVKHLP